MSILFAGNSGAEAKNAHRTGPMSRLRQHRSAQRAGRPGGRTAAEGRDGARGRFRPARQQSLRMEFAGGRGGSGRPAVFYCRFPERRNFRHRISVVCRHGVLGRLGGALRQPRDSPDSRRVCLPARIAEKGGAARPAPAFQAGARPVPQRQFLSHRLHEEGRRNALHRGRPAAGPAGRRLEKRKEECA